MHCLLSYTMGKYSMGKCDKYYFFKVINFMYYFKVNFNFTPYMNNYYVKGEYVISIENKIQLAIIEEINDNSARIKLCQSKQVVESTKICKLSHLNPNAFSASNLSELQL